MISDPYLIRIGVGSRRLNMNTKIEYFYRDACNYKAFHYEIVDGNIEYSDIEPFLKEKSFLFHRKLD